MALSTVPSPATGDPATASWAQTVAADVNAMLQPASFIGSIIATAQSIAAGSNIDFTSHIVEDTVSGWNSTNKNWVAATAGLYMISAALKCNATPAVPVILMLKNGASYALGPAINSIANAGADLSVTMRLAAGDTVALRTINTYATQNDTPAHNNFLIITQVGFI